jgi:NADP-dependent 3-hydroxy acid dehydrogenase YdfG
MPTRRLKEDNGDRMAGFKDKVVVVTGAASGIGMETVIAFARRGAA